MKNLLVLVFIFMSSFVIAQVGGTHTYTFLNTTNSARMAALGMDMLAVKDNDVTLSTVNPSLITAEMDNHLALNFVDYFAGISSGFVTYSRTLNELGSFQGTMQFMNYGRFTEADATGQTYGTFSANDLALSLGWGRTLNPKFSIGANAKIIYSNMESYWSMGFAVDISGTYCNEDNGLTMTLLARNLGRQLKSYVPGNNESLPMNVQFALSKRLKHLPFRFYLILDHLEKPDLTYDDSGDLSDEATVRSELAKYSDMVMRHIIGGGEMMLSKNFHIRVGYNYRRRSELKVDTRISTVGISWGFGFKVSKFHFDFGRATYHLSGAPNHITITTNLSDLIKRSSSSKKIDR